MTTPTAKRPRSNRSKPHSRKEKSKAIRNFEDLKGSEHERWRRANESVSIIATKDLWPGCVGIALMFDTSDVEEGNRIWNDRLRVLTMFDVPPGQILGSRTQETRWTTVSQPELSHGGIVIGRDGLNFDFRQCPYDTRRAGMRIITAGDSDPLSLNHQRHSQVFKVANKVLETVISFGFRFRRNWGKPNGKLIYGSGAHDRLMKPHEWFPIPYVGLPYGMKVDEARESQSNSDKKNKYLVPTGIREAFIRDFDKGLPIKSAIFGTYLGQDDPNAGELTTSWERDNLVVHELIGNQKNKRVVLYKDCKPVKAAGMDFLRGSVFAYRYPDTPKEYEGRDWKSLNPSRKWFALPKLIGKARFDWEYKNWFNTKAVWLTEDTPVLPYELVSQLATHPGRAEDFPIGFWQLPDNWSELYDHASGALIGPPIRLAGWDDFNMAMPYDVALRLLDRGDPRLPFRPKLSAEEKRQKRAERKASRRRRRSSKRKRQLARAAVEDIPRRQCVQSAMEDQSGTSIEESPSADCAETRRMAAASS